MAEHDPDTVPPYELRPFTPPANFHDRSHAAAELRCLLEYRKRGPQQRTATVARDGIDMETRTVELAFSSETESVERWFGIEVLGHGPGEVDLSRLNNSAPLLWMHDQSDQRGVVMFARIDADGVGRALVRFSTSADADQLFRDICDGIVTKVSVGYSVEGLQLVEERGDTPVYRITAWTPFEISMVSIPADDSVGVGRTADTPGNFSLRSAANLTVKETPPTMNLIQEVIDAGRSAVGDIPVAFDDAGNVRHVHRRKAAAVRRLSLRTSYLPQLAADDFSRSLLPSGTEAGKKSKLSQGVLDSSRVHRAGSPFLIVSEAEPAQIVNGVPTFRRQEVRYDHIEPAHFEYVIDGDEVPESALAVTRAAADLDNMKAYGVRIPLTRAEMKSFRDGELADNALVSIVAGIGRLADRVLFGEVLNNTPEAFSIAKAAAQGLAWSDLYAFVGTDAAGAQIAPDGTLRAAGVVAELTPESNATVVGNFAAAALAVAEDITLVAERTNAHGSLVLTAWCNMECLLPAPQQFWTVEA